MLLQQVLLSASEADKLIRAFLLGMSWCAFLALVFYTAFYRRDAFYKWATLSLAGMSISYSLYWLTLMIPSVRLDGWLTFLTISLRAVMLASAVGMSYALFDRVWSARFNRIFLLCGLVFICSVLARLMYSVQWQIVDKLIFIVVLIDLNWLAIKAIQSNKRGGAYLLLVNGLVLAGNTAHLITLMKADHYVPFAQSIPVAIFTIGAYLMGVLIQLAIYNTQTQKQLALERAEHEQYLRQENERLEQEVAHRTAELTAANRTKDRLFSIISHDLRSPIAALTNALQLIEYKALSPEEFNNMAHSLADSTRRLHGSLDNLLNWSLSQLDEIKANPTLLDVRALANSVLEIAEIVAQPKQIHLSNDVPAELMVIADDFQLKTVLRNLLDNAIKFTPVGGQVRISGCVTPEWGELSVSDTGMGMAPNLPGTLLPQPGTGTAGERGMGLGLRLCQELAQRNGGQLHIDSGAGQGTTIRLRLPLMYDV